MNTQCRQHSVRRTPLTRYTLHHSCYHGNNISSTNSLVTVVLWKSTHMQKSAHSPL